MDSFTLRGGKNHYQIKKADHVVSFFIGLYYGSERTKLAIAD